MLQSNQQFIKFQIRYLHFSVIIVVAVQIVLSAQNGPFVCTHIYEYKYLNISNDRGHVIRCGCTKYTYSKYYCQVAIKCVSMRHIVNGHMYHIENNKTRYETSKTLYLYLMTVIVFLHKFLIDFVFSCAFVPFLIIFCVKNDKNFNKPVLRYTGIFNTLTLNI